MNRSEAADRTARATSDRELLRRVQRGDETALVDLYDRYGGLILTVALRIVGEREVAEEVMQDTFLRCWNAADTYEAARGNVAAWLVRIARNRAIDVLRSRHHRSRLRERTPLPSPDDLVNLKDEADEIATRQAVATAIGALPLSHRQIVELAYYGGLTQAEIARQLGEPIGTIKSRSRAAMDQLRSLLRPHFMPDLQSGDDR